MVRSEPTCFVIMPFAAELNYFFLYLTSHVEQTQGVLCRRADQKFSTKPVREKISDHIRTADIIIVDCTGNNPNVLYELGIAHALEKDVILITQDSMADVPSSVIEPDDHNLIAVARECEFTVSFAGQG